MGIARTWKRRRDQARQSEPHEGYQPPERRASIGRLPGCKVGYLLVAEMYYDIDIRTSRLRLQQPEQEGGSDAISSLNPS